MKCGVCGREGASDLCASHDTARESLKTAYPLWSRAYGGMDWKDYLDNIIRNAQTGRWVKEVAVLLRGG